MRMPRVRASLRWMLIGVAYLAIGMHHYGVPWLREMSMRREEYLSYANTHGRWAEFRLAAARYGLADAEEAERPDAKFFEYDGCVGRRWRLSAEECRALAGKRRRDAVTSAREAQVSAAMRLRCLRAARFPWTAIDEELIPADLPVDAG